MGDRAYQYTSKIPTGYMYHYIAIWIAMANGMNGTDGASFGAASTAPCRPNSVALSSRGTGLTNGLHAQSTSLSRCLMQSIVRNSHGKKTGGNETRRHSSGMCDGTQHGSSEMRLQLCRNKRLSRSGCIIVTSRGLWIGSAPHLSATLWVTRH